MYDDEANPFLTKHRIQAPDARLCPRCLGMKMLAHDVPPGHPRFATVTPCPQCNRNGQESSGPTFGRGQ